MREIKFRAYDKQLKKMFAVESIDFQSGTVVGAGGIYPRDSVELIQFTGLKDKNGKEIYEGDILSYPKHEGYYLIQWLYEDEECGFSCERDKPSYNYMLPIVWKKMKIVGNIYENPELLKENGV